MSAWANMKHDLLPLGPMTLREKVHMWATYYWRPTRKVLQKFGAWWHHSVLRYPRCPPFEQDPVAQHLGLVEGVPACTGSGERCAEHGLVTDA